jgi:hypothetical protein
MDTISISKKERRLSRNSLLLKSKRSLVPSAFITMAGTIIAEDLWTWQQAGRGMLVSYVARVASGT